MASGPALARGLALLLLAGAPIGSSAAEDPAPAPAPAPGGGDAPKDEADEKVPFVEEVNRAIDEGVRWLLARPKLFTSSKTPMAHWGLINSTRFYGAAGAGYGHPAGPTALAMYTLLKCGVEPDHPTIVEGFNWLRTPHTVTEEYDGQDSPVGFSWSHADKNVSGSYELSAMILALTAKYDRFKRGKNSAAAAKAGKLRIKDPADLEWLQSMVTSLVARRGMPLAGKPIDPPKARLGWRYNEPPLSLSRGGGRGGGGGATWKREELRPPNANQDLSSTQLATLALFSARRFGVEVKPDVWFDIVEFTLSHQEPTGPERERHDPGYKAGASGYAAGVTAAPKKDRARGFFYLKGSTEPGEALASGAMTACGVANLLMAREVLAKDEKALEEWKERGYDQKVEAAIWDGLAWLDLNWSATKNPLNTAYHVYYLYALERAMDLLGKNLVGTRPWYSLCAKPLIEERRPVKVKVRGKKETEGQGALWNTNSTVDPRDVLDTCFALLFLKRATKDLEVPPPLPTVTPSGG
jgi:hypothetical protein